MRSIFLLIVLVMWASCTHAVLSLTASDNVPTGGVLWRTKLVNTTYSNISQNAEMFRASRAGSLMLFTDVTQRLYAIDTATGRIQWTFTEWSNPGKQSIQISGGTNHALVINGLVAYCFEISSGNLLWKKPITNGQATSGGIWVQNEKVLICGENDFQAWNVYTGNLIWIFQNLWTPSYGAISVNATAVAVVKKPTSNVSNDAAILVLDKSTGEEKMSIPLLPKDIVGGQHPIVFQMTPVFLLFFTPTEMAKIDVSNGKPFWRTQLPFQAFNYGLGSPYIYLHTGYALYSYSLESGSYVSSVLLQEQDPNRFIKIAHLWGFDGFACLGMLQKGPGGTIVQNVSGFNGNNMTLRYSIVPPKIAPGHQLYGNSVAIGTVAAPAPDGFTLINRNGQSWSQISQFPDTVAQSVLLTGTTVMLTFGDEAAAVQMPWNN